VAGLSTSHSWPAALAAAQLARRWHTPLHLMNFLTDARERHVLRTVGPVCTSSAMPACRTSSPLPQQTAVIMAALTSS